MNSEPEENQEVAEKGTPNWLITFGDLMTLLLCFFVLLLAFSETDKILYKEIAGSLSDAFGVQRKYKILELETPTRQKIIAKDFDQRSIPTLTQEEVIATQLKKAISEELKKGKDNTSLKNLIEVEAGENEVSIKFMGESTFASGKADIKPEMVAVFKKIASVLKSTKGDIRIDGHTDNVPIIKGGAYKSNLVLSMARASTVAEFLINKGHIKAKRIAAMGYGKYRPVASNLTQKGRQKNRRVEIILSTKDIEKNPVR